MLPVLVLAGPTASGKSAAALRVAREKDGEVVNADALQVYGDLAVLTARPWAAEEAGVPHHLYGHVDGAVRYSAGTYAREAAGVIDGIRARGRVPVVVGGTGLYLRALTEGLSPVPPLPEAATAEAEALWAEGALRSALLAADPAASALAPADRQRHVRAYAVWRATGRTLTAWKSEPPLRLAQGPFRAVVLSPPREALRARIERRWSAMREAGAVAEAGRLLTRGLPPDLPVMKALGLAPLAAELRGEIGRDEADTRAVRDTQRFAKRQRTWFRGQTGWPWAEDEEGAVAALR